MVPVEKYPIARRGEQVCRYCDEPIELVQGVWICTRSGDDGGTYDWCDESPTVEGLDHGKHEPAR